MAGKGKQKDIKIAPKDDTPGENCKKPPMKTASDVVNRLTWDDSLPKDKFKIGYLDRFDGIVEKSFDAFDWRDLSTLDNHTLAIPKHRIQYFKYLNRKVWDKRNRTDIIFGSTGHPFNIYDFMSKVDDDILNFRDEDVDTLDPMHHNVSEYSDEINNEEEIEIKDRPNFFIAARIENQDIIKNLNEVSDYIKSKDELLGECCIPPKMLHMTLAILKLENVSEIRDAIIAMQATSEKSFAPVTLSLQGLDNFHHRVLYSRVEENDKLMNLRKNLIEDLVSNKCTITDRYSFVPHVTVAKLSRPVTRLRHSKYIDQYLYLQFEDNEFGIQEISNLYLCEMGSARREDGFYKCAYEVSINNPPVVTGKSHSVTDKSN
ncbi:leukocyte receptor cluster member 9 [Caerostris darwini]|uniref:Leukocyte receptor cluster member 9 n=1 Tax=Caerostris darwini TaxID=1538125 RepID=A0AAV4VRX3_9ARAC|nr:leukocyte receptor cluster member 9 [Caerostris darwini]